MIFLVQLTLHWEALKHHLIKMERHTRRASRSECQPLKLWWRTGGRCQGWDMGLTRTARPCHVWTVAPPSMFYITLLLPHRSTLKPKRMASHGQFLLLWDWQRKRASLSEPRRVKYPLLKAPKGLLIIHKARAVSYFCRKRIHHSDYPDHGIPRHQVNLVI